MKKVLLVAAPLLLVLAALPIIGAVVVTMSSQSAAQCRTDTVTGAGPSDGAGVVPVSSDLGDLGVIEGPIGGPVNGTVTLSQANIPNRSGLHGFRASMPRVLAHDPDFVTLNEISGRSLGEITGAAPGYDAFRAAPAPGRDSSESMTNAVLWKRATWAKVNAGRVKIVSDDQLYRKGEPRTWDRYATWVMLRRISDGAVVSVVATHHMTNPHKYPRQHGNPALTRVQQYGAGMDILTKLQNSLATHGPVLVGGDMNTHASYTNLPWSAVAKMGAAGYAWANHGVDYVFFPQHQGARLAASWTGSMVSDHQWLTARIRMNGIGPTPNPTPGATPDSTSGAARTAGATTTSTSSSARAVEASAAASEEAPSGADVLPAVMQLRFSSAYPTLTAEQARNAIVIAQAAREHDVSRYGLEVAIATAIQESKLVNLEGGDRDSAGLFQQRPSSGWGSHSQVTDPALAAAAFFGRAQHTDNPGLLDVRGWEQMSVTEAAQAVQRSGFPDAYAQWEVVARDIAELLGGDLPQVTTISSVSDTSCTETVNAASFAGCTAPGQSDYSLGEVKPELTAMVNVLGPMFDIRTVGGYRASATDPHGHPAGLAADFMVPITPAGRAQGQALATYAQQNASRLGIDYIIWYQQIWSTARAAEGWRPMADRGGPTENHVDHVHINVKPGDHVAAPGAAVDGSSSCSEVVYPVPAAHVGSDRHNWHDQGSSWSTWHTGTDFSAPCGTPVYAAHAGTIQIDTTQGWAGPALVKVSAGPKDVTTWYAHMETVTVSRGAQVQPGQQIGAIGNKGNSHGCHLHFEVHLKNGTIYGPDNVDPSDWLANHATPQRTLATGRGGTGFPHLVA